MVLAIRRINARAEASLKLAARDEGSVPER